MDIKEKYLRSDHQQLDKKTGKVIPVHDIHDFNTGRLAHYLLLKIVEIALGLMQKHAMSEVWFN